MDKGLGKLYIGLLSVRMSFLEVIVNSVKNGALLHNKDGKLFEDYS